MIIKGENIYRYMLSLLNVGWENYYPYFFCDRATTFPQERPDEQRRKYTTIKDIDALAANFEQNEGNYFAGMIDGLQFAFKHIENTITPDYIVQLHRHAFRSNIGSAYAKPDQLDYKNQEPRPPHYDMGFYIMRADDNGLRDNLTLVKPLLEKFPNLQFFWVIDEAERVEITRNSTTTELEDEYPTQWERKVQAQSTIDAAMQYILDKYHIDIQNACNHDELLLTFVKTIKTLELLHPFLDGNCRTFCMLLLNVLLIQNSLSPCLLTFDPNWFDAMGIDEMNTLIKQGQQKFSQLTTLPPCHYQPEGELQSSLASLQNAIFHQKKKYSFRKRANQEEDMRLLLESSRNRSLIWKLVLPRKEDVVAPPIYLNGPLP